MIKRKNEARDVMSKSGRRIANIIRHPGDCPEIPMSQFDASPQDLADAAHIVRCVNMHDELIEALVAAFHCIEDEPHRPNVADNAVTPERALALIKSVLAKARAGE